MHTAEEAIEWIHSLLPFGMKPGLKRMEWMLEALGNPEKQIDYIHIGGTNGKGSTVSYMRNVLEAGGYKIGTFTSPYIELFQERISVNGQPISDEDLLDGCVRIRPLVEELQKSELGSPTEFEVITALAFDYFANKVKPDLVLLEVGLGGRMDSTNVIQPLLSIITSIGHDHMHILGDTLGEIAYEKAGIIKEKVPVVTAVEQDEAWEVIDRIAAERGATVYRYNRDFMTSNLLVTEDEQSFTTKTPFRAHFDYRLQMKGPHQISNAALAIMGLDILCAYYSFQLDEQAFKQGLWNTTWIGRFETVSHAPLTIVDGAHNAEGWEALAKTLELHYPSYTYRFVVACTKEKDMEKLLAPFQQWDARFTFTSFEFFRAEQAKVLYEQAPVKNKHIEEDWKKAIRQEQQAHQEGEMLIVSGSLYFIALVRRYLLSEQSNQTTSAVALD
ncbi:bifunctional folylpolyglutamate synthase/dihydrofolate synthase [Halalkalibacterium ligniniphilum]|uniref:bifunctional folylpolyglutamate synthase/dihydrofolate synthase n=1 Tax=Halalkalibacterium ligniniphilum TaxID=1134413 RepID=UPI00034A9CD1|nr:folylpolyglutamate synthase/dihydrofolate synthase family protein [Halalkalibacterium ligniniphilum]